MLLDILGFVRTKQVSTRPGHNFELVWAMLQNFGEGDTQLEGHVSITSMDLPSLHPFGSQHSLYFAYDSKSSHGEMLRGIFYVNCALNFQGQNVRLEYCFIC